MNRRRSTATALRSTRTPAPTILVTQCNASHEFDRSIGRSLCNHASRSRRTSSTEVRVAYLLREHERMLDRGARVREAETRKHIVHHGLGQRLVGQDRSIPWRTSWYSSLLSETQLLVADHDVLMPKISRVNAISSERVSGSARTIIDRPTELAFVATLAHHRSKVNCRYHTHTIVSHHHRDRYRHRHRHREMERNIKREFERDSYSLGCLVDSNQLDNETSRDQ